MCQELIQVIQREASEVPPNNAICPLLWHGHAEADAVACSTLLGRVLDPTAVRAVPMRCFLLLFAAELLLLEMSGGF